MPLLEVFLLRHRVRDARSPEPLSAMSRSGRLRGRPRPPGRGTRIASSTASRWALSWRWPAVWLALSVLGRQCLDRRIPAAAPPAHATAAWAADRNAAPVAIHWRFPTADARITLTHLDPVFKPVK